ncbi:hypothetical protein BATDEDRAFT_26274 [Batrachochytrium dendrobatidis JAM81]|uniref:Snurportin-1 n=1 Tax=Batrachochytrium dendrobatidis (strain JAM81 / FGSC 10211) TaxID=684364 RepID=F4P7B0_BATDJ|nr:uncharacterized protein BATDEDRAFT_26274 [Batrachochytrium dendrobatidis JAM81]EGF79077.1 hypothetical protein BATDEDRAFT_26274 [Batrachochytrium dendrobatidis JAM81]|eukprot:XP_006680348.1 hypothetical protein BATDEDRAFT_26274 [Batrachochytrium dendrobatidis JAM81]
MSDSSATTHIPNVSTHRISQYKFQPSLSQDVRRQRALEFQKKRRLQQVDAARKLTEKLLKIDAEVDSVEFDVSANYQALVQPQSQYVDAMEITDPNLTIGSLQSGSNVTAQTVEHQLMVMLPEPLMEIPLDFTSGWLAMVFPQGERCLIISSRGKTISRRAHGQKIESFLSCLPGGSYATIQYWLHSKISEVDVGRRTKANQRCILPLQTKECTPDNLKLLVAQAELDSIAAGLFLINKQCMYAPGEKTPLFCAVAFPGRSCEMDEEAKSYAIFQAWLSS